MRVTPGLKKAIEVFCVRPRNIFKGAQVHWICPSLVTFCKPAKDGDPKPRLRIIRDPISKLTPEMLYRQIQFVIAESDWTKQGEDVE